MEFRTLLFTTQKNYWFKSDLEVIRKALEQARGIRVSEIEVRRVDINRPVTRTDKDGDVRIDWGWFEETFQTPGYEAIAFHCSEEERDAWGLSKSIGGSYLRDKDHIIEFWFCADKNDKANYYNQSEFWRRFLHEMSHGFERFLYGYESELTHHYDYKLHAIDDIYKLYDWTRWVKLKKKHDSLLVELVSLLSKKLAALLSSQPLLKPISDTYWKNVTQAYGIKSPRYPITGTHIGVDIACPEGTPIYAPADGEIVDSGRMHSKLGNWCCFRYLHQGRQYELRLAHLFFEPLRAKHKRGEVFAYSGNTGSTSGPHVHLEVWPDEVDLAKLETRSDVFEHTLDPHKVFV